MRKGENTSKDKILNLRPCSHRVIVPLYIPHQESYFKESYSVFKLCLSSINKTTASPIKVSVISNGSCVVVNEKLLELQKLGEIDELIIEKEPIGKINSILKALRTAEERLITITDADVLFLNNWEKAVLDVFESFPRAGMVSPLPIFRNHFKLTANIWIDYFFSKKLFFREVINPKALTKFAQSIGWSRLDNKYKDVIATLRSNDGAIAVVGATHMVATFKKEVFDFLPKVNSSYKLGGDSEYKYMDKPVSKCNAYRLSTYNNYVYHMGNTKEGWMETCYNNLEDEPLVEYDFSNLKRVKKNYLMYYFSNMFFQIILKVKFLRVMLLRFRGVKKEKIKNFIH